MMSDVELDNEGGIYNHAPSFRTEKLNNLIERCNEAIGVVRSYAEPSLKNPKVIVKELIKE